MVETDRSHEQGTTCSALGISDAAAVSGRRISDGRCIHVSEDYRVEIQTGAQLRTNGIESTSLLHIYPEVRAVVTKSGLI